LVGDGVLRSEIEELKRWKLIGEGLEVGNVVRTFVEHGYHRDPY
jgi:hypothetical protein